MEQIDVKAQLISEIVKLLDIKPAEIVAINEEFQALMARNTGTTEEMIRSCKDYDHASFLAGAMITTSVLDVVRDVYQQKAAEQDRLEGNRMDAM